MEITSHALWTLIHGMGFGGLYLLACSGAIVELWRRYAPTSSAPPTKDDQAFIRVYLMAMAAFAWGAVLTGAYVVYPWYRAVPPAGTISLNSFPQQLLLSSPSTAAWHSIGMEWKEYTAWVTPIAITMACAVLMRYGRGLRDHQQLRNQVLGFVAVSMLTAGIAAFFGAGITGHAPIQGGRIVYALRGE